MPAAERGAGSTSSARAAVRTAVDDVLVARAAAEVAADRPADLRLGRVGVAREQVLGGEQHSRQAEAALEGVRRPRTPAAAAMSAPSSARPSIVTISPPSTATASCRQDFVIRPSSDTVHAPQSPVAQPTFGPMHAEAVTQRLDQQHPRVDRASRALTVERQRERLRCWSISPVSSGLASCQLRRCDGRRRPPRGRTPAPARRPRSARRARRRASRSARSRWRRAPLPTSTASSSRTERRLAERRRGAGRRGRSRRSVSLEHRRGGRDRPAALPDLSL